MEWIESVGNEKSHTSRESNYCLSYILRTKKNITQEGRVRGNQSLPFQLLIGYVIFDVAPGPILDLTVPDLCSPT